MYADHNFHIGEQHLKNGMPCQDYALSGTLKNGIAYAIVADGCSSGGKTDIGARLTALATEQAIRECIRIPLFFSCDDGLLNVNDRRSVLLELFRTTLGLESSDMLATCLWTVVSADGMAAHVTGDGTVVVQHELDTLTHHYEWASNVPYYPAYCGTEKDDSFRAHHAATPEPLTYIVESTVPGMGGVPDGLLSTHTVDEGMAGMWVTARHAKAGQFPGRIRSVALFSDGIAQIDNISHEEAVRELLAFKSSTGRFVTRRMNRYMTDVKKHGRGPIDDIACAVIAFDPLIRPEGEFNDTHNQTNEGDA